MAKQIVPEERARIVRAARQVASYAAWLRWAASFPQDALQRHPRHTRLALLSPMLSGRFCFAVAGGTLFLGVQRFEAAWMSALPLETAYVEPGDEYLYLFAPGVQCLDGKLPSLGVGIYSDDHAKRERMAQAQRLQAVMVTVSDGQIASVQGALRPPLPLRREPILAALARDDAEQRAGRDLARFF